jgi:hypothetical protein
MLSWLFTTMNNRVLSSEAPSASDDSRALPVPSTFAAETTETSEKTRKRSKQMHIPYSNSNLHKLVWVTVGKTEHPAWLVGDMEDQKSVLIQWESTSGQERVSPLSIRRQDQPPYQNGLKPLTRSQTRMNEAVTDDDLQSIITSSFASMESKTHKRLKWTIDFPKASKTIDKLAWVTVGKTEHQAWLVEDMKGQKNVIVQWESTSGQERVPALSIRRLKQSPLQNDLKPLTRSHARLNRAVLNDEIIESLSMLSKSSPKTVKDESHHLDPKNISDLPTFALLEIVSFIYDDLESVRSLIRTCRISIDHEELRRHVRASILERPESAMCRICDYPICYPYRLVECGHQVCGRCAWKNHREACGCGVVVHSRPSHINPSLADRRAFWLLSKRANRQRLAQNEKRIHRGSAGIFGRRGKPNQLEPFHGVGFLGDFDDTPTLDISFREHVRKLPSASSRKIWITLCPMKRNYSPFPISKMSAQELCVSWPNFLDIFRTWFRTLNSRDVILIGEERTDADIYCLSPKYNHFEVRLVGWEHLAQK